jgi:hypothetical protein
MLGDYDEALCRPSERSGVLRTRYEVLLSVSNGRGQLRSVSMIRPASTEDARLVFGADGWVAAITDGHCRWIYDTRDGHGVVGDELPRRSPFLFLDDVTPGREDDLAAITKRVVSPYLLDDSPQTRFLLAHPDDPASKDLYRDEDLFVEIPTESSLLDALDSKNPWIRSATRRIIAAGGADMYPDATRRLASAPK